MSMPDISEAIKAVTDALRPFDFEVKSTVISAAESALRVESALQHQEWQASLMECRDKNSVQLKPIPSEKH